MIEHVMSLLMLILLQAVLGFDNLCTSQLNPNALSKIDSRLCANGESVSRLPCESYCCLR